MQSSYNRISISSFMLICTVDFNMPMDKQQLERVTRRSKTMSVRRAWILCSIYGLFFLHLVHWKIYGRTLSPFELNEAMFTLEHGVITVGAIFLGVILLSVFIFGRFFCSWGCHILALQDLTGWLLAKWNLKPKPIRSRLLPLVAVGSLLYMFVWPTVMRLAAGKSWPGLRVLTDEEGLGSFTTEYLTRNLPGPVMTTVTFIVVGGLVVWFLGTRGFCRFVCPYGALFSAIDRVSPSGIQLVGTCDGCGYCTAACTTHIRVHHEIQVHGKVVSPSCLKDLDCVSSCPRDAIKFGFGKPSLLNSFDNFVQPSVQWTWSWLEEIIAAIVCLVVLLITRNLYGEVPFLLALTFGVISAWASVITFQLFRVKNLRVVRVQLKSNQQYSRTSVFWVAGVACISVLLIHSAWIRWHEYRGQTSWMNAMQGDHRQVDSAIDHLGVVIDRGLWRPPYADRMLADLYIRIGDQRRAIPHLIQLTNRWPNDQRRKNQLQKAIKAEN